MSKSATAVDVATDFIYDNELSRDDVADILNALIATVGVDLIDEVIDDLMGEDPDDDPDGGDQGSGVVVTFTPPDIHQAPTLH